MLDGLEAVKQIAAKLTKQQFNAQLSDVSLIEGHGEVNRVYEVGTGRHQAILRLNDSTELERYRKERWCINAARKHGVPTPEVFCIGKDKNIDCAYMLLECIHGTTGEAIVDTNDTWYALGKNLRLIHSIPVRGFGDSLEAITSGNSKQWRQYLESNVQALASNVFIEKIGLTKATALRLQSMINSLSVKRFSFGLNHGDYSLANIIVSDQGIPHVIDWGSAQAHIVPHHDLAVILEESLDEDSEKYASLLSGYGVVWQAYETIRHEIKILQLLDALDKVRWAMDRARSRLDYHMERLNTFVGRSET
jgi:aminoglycoside phosphotransferase (APT) family kinase protein